MLNNYFHDLAVALLLSSVALAWFLAKEGDKGGPVAHNLIRRVLRKLTWLSYGSLAYILLGGVVRTLAYPRYEWMEAAGRGQLTALIIKHVFLAFVVFLGLFFLVRLKRRFRAINLGK